VAVFAFDDEFFAFPETSDAGKKVGLVSLDNSTGSDWTFGTDPLSNLSVVVLPLTP